MSDPVLELLRSKGLSHTISGRDYLIKCLNPEHTDTHPSFRVDKTTGICHCFSCGYKCNLFKHFGILTNNVSVRIAKLKRKLEDLMVTNNGLEPIEGAVAFNKTYRGITSATFKEFGAFTTTKLDKLADRLCFPLTDVRGKTVAYVGRNMLSDAGDRYANYPAGATLPLFPAKITGSRSIVLVEGLFDFLNCYDKGMRNVVCCFGTSKLYKDTAEKLMPYKVMGVEKIFLMYDGDEAGREAMTKLQPLLEECEFQVEIIEMDDEEDPGDLSQEQVEAIIKYIS